MKALVYDGESLALERAHPEPLDRPGWATIAVRTAGVCRTDVEIARGYMDFRGVLGHEFVGVVERCDAPGWPGRRVVGEINAACGACRWCSQDLGRHCPHRTVLGIAGLDGCLAERCSLPVVNLRAVPDDLSDDHAVFVEPLSAAYEIVDQLALSGRERCLVLGDGKLGILCAWVLATVCEDVVLLGHHSGKLQLAAWNGVVTAMRRDEIDKEADVVVEATGSGAGLSEAIELCRPRGTLVLKSTLARQGELNLAPIVVKELTVVGSRCGLFARGLQGLVDHAFPVERLIAARYPLEHAAIAIRKAAQPGVLKVLVDVLQRARWLGF